MSMPVRTKPQRGIQADLNAKETLKAAYKLFMNEKKPGSKNEAGKELVRAIFGTDAIAEDTPLPLAPHSKPASTLG